MPDPQQQQQQQQQPQQPQQPDPMLAAFQAMAQKNAAATKPGWMPQQGDPTHHIQIGNDHFLIHSEDLPEAQRRNPDLIVHRQVTSDPMLDAFKRRLTAKEAGVPTAATKPGAYQQTKEQAQAHIIHNVNEETNPFSDTTTSVIGSTGAMMKRPDETDSQFMARAVQAGRNVTPAQVAAETASNKRLAAPTLGVAAAAGPAMLGAEAATGAAFDYAAEKLGLSVSEELGLKEWVEQMGLRTPTAIDKARRGVMLLKAAGEAHPLVRQAIIHGLAALGGALGAGGIAKALGWIGKAAD